MSAINGCTKAVGGGHSWSNVQDDDDDLFIPGVWRWLEVVGNIKRLVDLEQTALCVASQL